MRANGDATIHPVPARPVRHRLISGFCSSAHGFAPRFLPTFSHPYAVALRFVRCGQLTGGLAPPRLRPCWAYKKRGSLSASLLRCSGTRKLLAGSYKGVIVCLDGFFQISIGVYETGEHCFKLRWSKIDTLVEH